MSDGPFDQYVAPTALQDDEIFGFARGGGAIILTFRFVRWCNGSTRPFGGFCHGSNPCRTATFTGEIDGTPIPDTVLTQETASFKEVPMKWPQQIRHRKNGPVLAKIYRPKPPTPEYPNPYPLFMPRPKRADRRHHLPSFHRRFRNLPKQHSCAEIAPIQNHVSNEHTADNTEPGRDHITLSFL